jgi:hypothetical protein
MRGRGLGQVVTAIVRLIGVAEQVMNGAVGIDRVAQLLIPLRSRSCRTRVSGR